LGVAGVGLGHWFYGLTVTQSWLFPIGLLDPYFTSSDYFPLFPHLGWFLLGASLGKLLYKEKRTLLPWKGADSLPIRFFRFCGRHSLWIYLIHQPVLYGLLSLFA